VKNAAKIVDDFRATKRGELAYERAKKQEGKTKSAPSNYGTDVVPLGEGELL